jgi:zinc transporter ZupT
MAPALLQTVLVLGAVSIVGAALPLWRRWSQRGLHLFVSVAAGIFLGVIFLHLLPELAAGAAHPGAGGGAALAPWAAALIGLVLLFFIEKIWLVGAHAAGHAVPGQHEHDVVWFATFIGLTVHSFATGLGYSGVAADPQLLGPFLGSIAVHQASESFSLATVMQLAGLPRLRALVPLAVYCLSTPVGLLVGAHFTVAAGGVSPVLTGLACGTFLYVAVGNLLPEVFHGGDHRFPRVVGLLLGLLIACAGVAGLR